MSARSGLKLCSCNITTPKATLATTATNSPTTDQFRVSFQLAADRNQRPFDCLTGRDFFVM
jgi:hypothetical protein